MSVLLGVRDDALAQLDRLKAHVPGIFDKDLRLHHLSPSGGGEAIEEPLITGLTEEQRETAAAVLRYLVTPSE